MSKTKKIKRKTTGFDIIYRVITAIMAVAMFPAFYFGNLITFAIEHEDISNLLNYFRDEDTLDVTVDSISLAKLPKLIDMFSGFTDETFDFKTAVLENELYRPLIVAAVFIAIALVLALVVLGFAIFSNKIKVITAISGVGFLSTFAARIAFGAFANPIVAGEITLSELLNIDGIISSLLIGYLGDVKVFALDSAFYSVMFLSLGILIWSISVMIVNASDEKEKAQKAMARAKKQ